MTLLTNLTIVPMDGPPEAPGGNVAAGSIRIAGDRITDLGDVEREPGEAVIDCGGRTAFPGFVQGHVHFCQTLFRGLADDRTLLEWLRERIWPLEAAHDARSARASAELTLIELVRGGTTSAQVMESVRHAEQGFEAAERAGITAILGNCLMDDAPDAPAGFATSRAEAMRISRELCDAFDGKGRMHYAISPRFVLSCSDELSREAAEFARERELRIHTHAGEHPDEVAAVRAAHGADYLVVLERQGLLGTRTSLAHCVHLSETEFELLRGSGSAVLHCPSTNLKLGSGLAPIARYRAAEIPVAIGADGAPANNRLSALTELRQAALVSSVVAGPGAWPAEQALHAATRGGALALGLDDVGCLAPGMRADLFLADLDAPELHPGGAPIATLVYSACDRHIRDVFVGGEHVVQDGAFANLDPHEVARDAAAEREKLLTRAGLRA